jgi:hypothetical protein
MTSSTAPTIWFEAPSISTNSPNPAGAQFMDVFNSPSTWQVTASQSVGFVVSELFILTATDAQLSEVIGYLKAHNMKMMMVAGMIPIQPNGVGNGLEGYTYPGQLERALQRLSSMGGTLDSVAMDAPLDTGHTTGTGAQLSITALAQQVATNVALVKALFPAAQFYDGEGIVPSVNNLVQWQQAFQQATGTPIVEFDADVNWNLSNWQSNLEAYAAAARASGATFGIAGNATNAQTTDASWALAAESNIAATEADPLLRPANIMVQTWNANPTVILPEGLSGTLSHVAVEITQFAPLYASGYLTGGNGVTVSTVAPVPSYVGSAADAVAGSAVAVPGVTIVAPTAPATMTFVVVLTDVSGTLGATASGAGHVSAPSANVLTLTGNLADINTALASLTYAGTVAGTDTIDVTTYDGVGLVDDHQITVTIAAPITVALPSGMAMATLYQNIYGHAASAGTLAAAQAQITAGKTLAMVAAPWVAQGQATISALYEQVQGVSPSASVLGSLTAALMGGQTVAQIRTSLANATTVQSELRSFYQSHYGTAPTASQLAALTQQLASGTSLETLEAPLLANSAAETQITTLYQQVEGQAPAAVDLLTNARAVLTGTSLATLRNTLANSALVQQNLSALYQHVYDQTATTAQLAALTAQIVGGTTYAQIQTQFTAVAQAAVTSIYQSVLSRAPTASELSKNTTNVVNGGVSRSSIWATLAYSAESGANVTRVYQQIMGQVPSPLMVTALEQFLCIHPTPLTQLAPDLQSAVTIYQQITGLPATEAALLPLVYDFLNQATIAQIRYWVGFSGQENQILQTTSQQLFGHNIDGTVANNVKLALVAGTTTMALVQAGFAAQAKADVPVITNVVATQGATPNSHVLVLGQVNVTDPDPGAVETVTVKLTGAGTLQGTTTPTTYVHTGTAANITANLRGLTFIPPAVGGTTWISFSVMNGAGNSTSSMVEINSVTMRSPAPTTFLYTPTQTATIAAVYPAETFVFPATGFGTDTITGFNIAQGVIELPKAIAASFTAVQSHSAASAGGTLISLGSSQSIFLAGVAPNTLHAANFAFV